MLFGYYKDENNAQAQQGASQATELPQSIGDTELENRGRVYEFPDEGETPSHREKVEAEAWIIEEDMRRLDECDGAIPAGGNSLGAGTPDCHDCDQLSDWQGVCNLDDNVKVEVGCKPWQNKDNETRCGDIIKCNKIEGNICYYHSYKCDSTDMKGCFIRKEKTIEMPINNNSKKTPIRNSFNEEFDFITGCDPWSDQEKDDYCGIKKECEDTMTGGTVDKCSFNLSQCSIGFENGRCYSWREDSEASGNSQDRL